MLQAGGWLCLAVVHPLNSAGKFDDVAPDSAFVIRGSYVESHRYEDTIERDGLTMTFHSVHRSMETYLGALADAGFVLEALREPTPDPEHVAAEPAAARWQRVPLFLHLRAVSRDSAPAAWRSEHMFGYTLGVTLAALPRRDPEARGALSEAGRRAAPVVPARERVLPVPGALGELLPGGAVVRGSVVAVDGTRGAGVTSLALALAAAATDSGEWAAALDLDATFGGEAAHEVGVALERFAVVRPGAAGLPPARWASVVAALLDGVSLVVTEVPRYARAVDARRLAARARERGSVLVPVVGPRTPWPAEATLRLHADGGEWRGLTAGAGLLTGRVVHVRVEGQGAAARTRLGMLSAGERRTA